MAHLDLTIQHAFIVAGAKDAALGYIYEALVAHQLPTQAHPDFLLHQTTSFGVDDAREIQSFLSEKAVGDKKVVLLVSAFFTAQSQNALLKTIEEPTVLVRIFFVTDSPLRLLETIRSRTVTHVVSSGEAFRDEVNELLALSKPERLARIATFLDVYDDEENHNRMREAVHALFSTLIRVLHEKYTDGMQQSLTLGQAQTLEKISTLIEYMLDNGSPVKMLCEAVLFLIPESAETK